MWEGDSWGGSELPDPALRKGFSLCKPFRTVVPGIVHTLHFIGRLSKTMRILEGKKYNNNTRLIISLKYIFGLHIVVYGIHNLKLALARNWVHKIGRQPNLLQV